MKSIVQFVSRLLFDHGHDLVKFRRVATGMVFKLTSGLTKQRVMVLKILYAVRSAILPSENLHPSFRSCRWHSYRLCPGSQNK